MEQPEQSWFYGSETEFRTLLAQNSVEPSINEKIGEPEMRLKLPLSEATTKLLKVDYFGNDAIGIRP